MQHPFHNVRVPTLTLCCAVVLAAAPTSKPTPWYLQPVHRPDIPSAAPAGNPIDAFLAAKRNEKGMQPAKPADKATLLRRVYLDLIGIPPTPAEQAAFLADSAPNAYEKVDRLLASEQYGVRF